MREQHACEQIAPGLERAAREAERCHPVEAQRRARPVAAEHRKVGSAEHRQANQHRAQAEAARDAQERQREQQRIERSGECQRELVGARVAKHQVRDREPHRGGIAAVVAEAAEIIARAHRAPEEAHVFDEHAPARRTKALRHGLYLCHHVVRAHDVIRVQVAQFDVIDAVRRQMLALEIRLDAGEIDAVETQFVEVLRDRKVHAHVEGVHRRGPPGRVVPEPRPPEVVEAGHADRAHEYQHRGRNRRAHARAPERPGERGHSRHRADPPAQRAHQIEVEWPERDHLAQPRAEQHDADERRAGGQRQRHAPPRARQQEQKGRAEREARAQHRRVDRTAAPLWNVRRPYRRRRREHHQFAHAHGRITAARVQAQIAPARAEPIRSPRAHARAGNRRRRPDVVEVLTVVGDGEEEPIVVVAFQECGVDRRRAAEIEIGVTVALLEDRAQVRIPRIAVHRRAPVVHARGVLDAHVRAQGRGLHEVAGDRLRARAATGDHGHEQPEQREPPDTPHVGSRPHRSGAARDDGATDCACPLAN